MKQETYGIYILPVFIGKGTRKKHYYLYWKFNERQGPIQALIRNNWKLVHFVELYILNYGPSEKNNLIYNFPEVSSKPQNQNGYSTNKEC
ncbi:hypothetical protein [Yeosuana marina]|uniref:hypothetical protein n=1 Tax=Yeosuana marina TaxID=1565536 RepID=UPI0030C89EDA